MFGVKALWIESSLVSVKVFCVRVFWCKSLLVYKVLVHAHPPTPALNVIIFCVGSVCLPLCRFCTPTHHHHRVIIITPGWILYFLCLDYQVFGENPELPIDWIALEFLHSTCCSSAPTQANSQVALVLGEFPRLADCGKGPIMSTCADGDRAFCIFHPCR